MSILYLQCDTGLSGGIAGYISSLVSSPLLQRINKVVIVPAAYGDYSAAERLYPNCKIEVLPKTYSGKTFFSYLFSLVRIIQTNNIKVIHAHALRVAFPAVIASVITRVPVIYTNHGIRFTQKNNVAIRFLFKIFEVFVCRFVTRVVCIREFDLIKMRSMPFLDESKLTVIRTRIEGPVKTGGPVEKNKRECCPLVVGIGSLIEVKRADRFISWVDALNTSGMHVDAVWVGDGPLRIPLKEKSDILGTSIRWPGHLGREGVSSLLSEASILFLTSEFEVLPLVVLEAYSFGVPVISGKFDGVHDFIIDGETGLLVDPDNEKMVAEKVKSLLEDQFRLVNIKSQARDLFHDKFKGLDAMVNEYKKIYMEFIR